MEKITVNGIEYARAEAAEAECERLRAQVAGLEVDLSREIASTATAQAKMKMLHNALSDVQAAFANQQATFNRKRQADSDPYHPANVAMCKALAAMRDDNTSQDTR